MSRYNCENRNRRSNTIIVMIIQIIGQQPMVYAVVRHPYERLVSSYLDFGTSHFDDVYNRWSSV